MIELRNSLVPAVGAAPSRGRLLIVDDEPGVLRVLKLILGRHYELATEAKAENALRRVVAGEKFDLIFSDLMMPGMTGIGLLGALEEMAPLQAIRMVFLTGGAVTVEAREFLAASTHDVIVKPFDAEEMIAFISNRLAVDGSLA
jgi:CheY-like chemotaxis protein